MLHAPSEHLSVGPREMVGGIGSCSAPDLSQSAQMGWSQFLREASDNVVSTAAKDLPKPKIMTFEQDEDTGVLLVDVPLYHRKIYLILKDIQNTNVFHIEESLCEQLKKSDKLGSPKQVNDRQQALSMCSLQVNGKYLDENSPIGDYISQGEQFTFAIPNSNRSPRNLRLSAAKNTREKRKSPTRLNRSVDFGKRILPLTSHKRRDSRDLVVKPAKCESVEIIKEIGRGASGAVYSCYVDGWICAMKEIQVTEDEEEEELRIYKQLPQHENFAQFLGNRRNGNVMQIFMKQYTCSLRELLLKRAAKNNYFSALEITQIATQIAHGLQFLHSNKIMHRDGKNNIRDCAIGDLDTAKLLEKDVKARSVIGTPAFIAPEVLTSNDEIFYTTKADVYSFGMVLLELLSLRLPYTEIPKSWLISKAVIEGVLPQLPTLGIEYSGLVAIFYACTKFSAPERPSANKLLKMLQKL